VAPSATSGVLSGATGGLLGEEDESMTPSLQNVRIRSNQSSKITHRKLEEYPETFTELDLMPMSCYSCGKVMRQLAIEESLKTGRTLRETMDELNYQRICCRTLIMESPSLVRLQKTLQDHAQIDLTNLTLEATEARLPGDLSGFFVGETLFEPTDDLTVVDEAPPGALTDLGQVDQICFTGQGPSLLEPTEHVNTFQFFMNQLGETQ